MSERGRVRRPAVAGMFYPADPTVLRRTVHDLLGRANPPELSNIRALIVPHAALQYSGPIAAVAYGALSTGALPSHIAMLGPSHFVPFEGVAVPEHLHYATPLGLLALDEALLEVVGSGIRRSDSAHRREHCLEVQWPFLQVMAERDVSLLPLLTGDSDSRAAVAVLETLLDRYPDTLMIVSSDLSHYLDQRSAELMDSETARAIERLRPADLRPRSACGLTGITALLQVAKPRGWGCRQLDLRTSGDTAGDRDRVVGYGAFAFTS